jgi:hypothetical protein
MKLRGCLFVLVAFIVSSCAISDEAPGFRITSYNFDLSNSTDASAWFSGFSDYPVSENVSAIHELQYGYAVAPGTAKKGIMLSGNNVSGELFMYFKHKVSSLDPNTQYTLTFDVEFLSNAQPGAGGDIVDLKAGATNVEPKTLIENDHYVLNVDKGTRGHDGVNMVLIGNIAVPEGSNGYVLQNRTNSPYNNVSYNTRIEVTSNSSGELWFIVGTDSGFEGVTTIYFTKISVVLSQVK